MDAGIVVLMITMSVLGSLIGTFTGMVPGIHVNTVSAVMASMLPFITRLSSSIIPSEHVAICVSSCIFSASIVHTFVDYVPSVFLGAPDADDVVGMLPGHRLLSEGKGMCAIRSAAIGSCIGACASILLSVPMQFLLTMGLGEYLDSMTWIVLIIAVSLMILHEDGVKGMMWASVCMILSGILGLMCMDLSIPSEGIVGEGTMLFPLLTGLFGMPAMLQSISNGRMVEQADDVRYPVGCIPGIKGVLTGMVTGWFPGITATTGAVISTKAFPERTPEGFISLTASIGTAASIMMLTTLSVTGKGRSGCLINISQILGDSIIGVMNHNYLLLLLTAAVATFLGYRSTISCGRLMSVISSRIDTALMNKCCIILIVSLVILMTGPYGLMILAISTVCGFLPIKAGVSRMQLTGCLIIPTLLSHLFLRDDILSILIYH